MVSQISVVFITAPDQETALLIGRSLVEERLAACANLLPGLRSIFHWQGRVEDEPEVLLILKTRAELVDGLTVRVKELHPYELPEVVALKVDGGLKGYLDWVVGETGTPDNSPWKKDN